MGIHTMILKILLFLFLCITKSESEPQSQYPFQNPITSSKYDQIIETRCRYINGRVNELYQRTVRKDEPIVYVFFVERKYFVEAINTNLRIELEVDRRTTLNEPLLFAIGQKKYMTTLELPFTFSNNENRTNAPVYYSAGKNLCIQRKDILPEGRNITVRVTTSSLNHVDFKLKLKLTSDFQLPLAKEISLDVSPVSPRYLGFQNSHPEIGVIKIKASSDSPLCMTLSVQSPQCPIYDKEVNVKFQGLYQTMTTQSAMTLELVNRFRDGFVVVLVVHDSDDKCSKSSYINPYDPPPILTGSNKTLPLFGPIFGTDYPRTKKVKLLITNESNVSGWIVFLVMFIPVFTTVLLILVVTVLFKNRHEWMRIEAEQKLTAVNCGLLTSMKETPRTTPQRLILQQDDHLVLNDLGVLPTPPEDDGNTTILSPTRSRPPSDFLKTTPSQRFYGKNKDNSHSKFRWRAELNISDFEQKDLFAMKKAGRRFYWTIIIVAIFYCIPVYQLILHYLRVLYRTGEFDICYYNYLCAHRLGWLIDFNHFWSNISYIIFGIAFMFFVGRRAKSMQVVELPQGNKPFNDRHHQRTRSGTNSIDIQNDKDDKDGCFMKYCGYAKIPTSKSYGVPQNYGIFYTLGIALIMEGILSAAYHLCPNQSSFQFDTCFMYVIAVLILLKVYQFRHSVHFGANHTFLILASFVLISVIGLMFEFQGSTPKRVYRWSFIVLQFVTMTLLALYIYSLGYVRSQDTRKLLTDWRIFGNLGQLREHCISGDRLILPMISFLMGAAVLVYCEIAHIDFATYLLYVLVSNVIGTTFYYVGIMKPLHGEFQNRTWVQPALYFAGAGIIGGFAVTYFVRSPAAWELSAAASRAGNEDCMKGWFPFYAYYDSHDAWHFLSAGALFLSFMALLIVDDDLLTTPQTRIPVF